MRKVAIIFAVFSLMTLKVMAVDTLTGVSTEDFNIMRSGDKAIVDMKLNLSELDLKGKRAVLLTPCIQSNNNIVSLTPIAIYSRGRYYHYLRENGEGMLSEGKEISYKKRSTPDVIDYHDEVPYEAWMSSSKVVLKRQDYGCCEKLLSKESGNLGTFISLPNLVYINPEPEIKIRSKEFSAFIDFPVNKSTISPNYRNNSLELSMINEIIDTIKSDTDITIKDISLKGYASPEGSYSNNERLSIARTEALKSYLMKQFDFSSSEILVDHEPEDWQGLKKYVETSDLDNKDSILSIIDTDMDLDAKDAKIKREYPEDYKYLLENCYPGLRHTDYAVNYNVRNYNSLEQIKEIIKTDPSKLSLNEMYSLAETLEPGSKEYDDIYALAVKTFPDDEIANLNAANIAMKSDDLSKAAKYLEKAGSSAEAEYARGVCSYLNSDYKDAILHLENASKLGLPEADNLLKTLR